MVWAVITAWAAALMAPTPAGHIPEERFSEEDVGTGRWYIEDVPEEAVRRPHKRGSRPELPQYLG
jgi:hypothetical protein